MRGKYGKNSAAARQKENEADYRQGHRARARKGAAGCKTRAADRESISAHVCAWVEMILAATIWIIGWLYTVGAHERDRQDLRKADMESKALKKITLAQAVFVLFFTWPHYLGYKK